jgi:Na+-translocating ferredoxin:NAD+ oxidoreductase RNF subunit RnfB
MDTKWLPVISEDLCTGCGLCVAACGPACLEVSNRIAVLERPADCGSEEHCIAACPEDAIQMDWLPSEGDRNFGVWRLEKGAKFAVPSEVMPSSAH